MKIKLSFKFIWIPYHLGGHKGEPFIGMKTSIRWQRLVEEYLKCSRDIEWQDVSFEKSSSQGQAICQFSSEDPIPDEWLFEGEQIELLNGFRVLAIGRILSRVSLE